MRVYLNGTDIDTEGAISVENIATMVASDMDSRNYQSGLRVFVEDIQSLYILDRASTDTPNGNTVVDTPRGGNFLFLAKLPNVPTDGIVANIAALRLVDVAGLPADSERTVQTVQQAFSWDPTSTATDDGITIVRPASIAIASPGRWLRILSHVPQWTAQTLWAVHHVAGNDENPGGPGAPLATLKEFDRRVRVYDTSRINPNPCYTILALDDVPDTDGFRLSGTVSPDSTVPIEPGQLVALVGQRTVNLQGTVATASQIADSPGNGSLATLTDAGVADYTPFVGQLVTMTSGALNHASAFIVDTTGGGATALLGPWALFAGTTPVTAAAGSPAPGDTYEVASLTSFSGDISGAGFLPNVTPSSFVFIDVQPDPFPVPVTIEQPILTISCRFQRQFVTHGNTAAIFITSLVDLSSAPGVWAAGALSSSGAIIIAEGTAFLDATVRVRAGITARFVDCVVVGGAVQTTVNNAPGADLDLSVDGEVRGGFVEVGGNVGLGIFDATVDGLLMKGMGSCKVSANVFGDGNGGYGLRVEDGSTFSILSGNVPTITGTSGDLILENSATAMPPLEPAAGGPLPALSALTTWGNWSAAPFSGNVMSYTTGSKITTLFNP